MQRSNIRFGLLNAFLTLREILFPLLQTIQLFIKRFFTLEQAALRALEFGATLTVFFFRFGTDLVNLLFCLENHFFFNVGGFYGCFLI